MHNFVEACRLIENNDFAEAEEALKSIIDEDPEHYPALNKLGTIQAAAGDRAAAKSYFEQSLEINPDYAPAIVNLGNMMLEAGEFLQAIEYYKRALEKDEDYCFAYYNLAIAYKRLGDYKRYILNIKEYKKLYSKGLKRKTGFFSALSRR